MDSNRILNFTALIGLLALTVYTLFIGRTLLLPLVSAVVIWYLIIRLTDSFQSIPGLSRYMPYAVALVLSLISTCYFLYFFFDFLTSSITTIVSEAPQYQSKLEYIFSYINQHTKAEIDYNTILAHINFSNIFSRVAYTLSSLAGYLSLISIYVLFLLLEYKSFDEKIKSMCDTEVKYQRLRGTIDHITTSINTYLKIKTVASLLTGFLSYLALKAMGVDYAGFWALLIFMLNFIPTIGSIAAVTFTLLAVSVQFSAPGPLLLLSGLLLAIQILVGNIIEPRFMGTYLNLSPLVILFSLAFWGELWGVLGMLLCVPAMTIVNITLAEFKQTRPLAILLSANGRV